MRESYNICQRINTYYGPNKTIIIAGYEGIPQNFTVNVVVWLVILVLFSIFRKIAASYSRTALVHRPLDTWMTLFYSDVKVTQPLLPLDEDSVDLNLISNSSADERENRRYYEGSLSWIYMLFKLKNEEIEQRAGIDAIHYLTFHAYLILYTGITMIFCIVILLPLNIHGVLKSPDFQQFGITTISNIPGDSPILWTHVTFGLIFFAIAFCLMTFYSRLLRSDNGRISLYIDNTLMISGISRTNCEENLIREHFRDAFPNVMVSNVQVSYDVRHLMDLKAKLRNCLTALSYCKQSTEAHDVAMPIIPRCCGVTALQCRRCCKCCGPYELTGNEPSVDCDKFEDGCGCCCCKEPIVDSVAFYSKRITSLTERIKVAREKSFSLPIGIAFVTFENALHAREVHQAYNRCRFCARRPSSVHFKRLKCQKWSVDYAPTPTTLIWQNLAVKRTYWWIKAFLLNLIVFLFAFFLTTPLYVLNLVSRLQITEFLHLTNPYLVQIFPSIVLWASSLLLPYMVYYSDYFMKYWTRTSLNFASMVKTVALLLMMILILPSLGLTSVPALLEWLIPVVPETPITPANRTNDSLPDFPPPITQPSFRWECIFMPDNGAFFVNYIITFCFIGSAFELARLPSLFMYTIRLLSLRSIAEKVSAQKAVLAEFDFGLNYAWLICVFAVITSYSILCPLITPFGFVCLLLRYSVARYNLYYVYLPSRVDSRLHWLATSLMLACVLMMQVNIFVFIALRVTYVSPALAIFALLSLVITFVWFLFSVFAGWIYISGKGISKDALYQPLLVSQSPIQKQDTFQDPDSVSEVSKTEPIKPYSVCEAPAPGGECGIAQVQQTSSADDLVHRSVAFLPKILSFDNE